MKAFREQSTIEAIKEAANIRGGFAAKWLKRFAKFPWFKPWLLRGAEPPSYVHAVSALDVKRAKRAWDYPSALREDRGSWWNL